MLIDANWPTVVQELNAIFGGNAIPFTKPERAGETDVDEAVDELEDSERRPFRCLPSSRAGS